ncbi:uncharacterized protein DSM5745_01557 [Aspergillus mulundensis]|uniref:Protein kinase domain-containing protein n=1 Tax=Aspergillus mulundensis TaxID=1810919 RepID=A0A3D8T6R1_9EURO|nr:Uncharacterized protein DSM5745_01557 [Aspergillus mulundensis]RDW94235.1 Uncharacterized protein DSM5745_01557 [Aspergillus mulundensis]
MEAVSFAFATASVLELCLQTGKAIYTRSQAYRRAEPEIYEANIRIQGSWLKIEHQLTALLAVWEALPSDYILHQERVLQVLQMKLESAAKRLDRLMANSHEDKVVLDPTIDAGRLPVIRTLPTISRVKYALYAKASLERIVEDLDKWQRDFDPSWFFLGRMAIPIIDQELAGKRAAESNAVRTLVEMRDARRINASGTGRTGPIFLSSRYKITQQEGICLSSASTGRNSLHELLILDHVPVTHPSDVEHKTKEVRTLAKVLSSVDPELSGLLRCLGVIKLMASPSDKPTGFNFVFNLPPFLHDSKAIGLRSVLLEKPPQYPLTDRVALAVSLARAVVFFHSSGFVHKNILPENIVLCQPSPGTLGTPFLVGFDQLRAAEGRTYMAGDNRWEGNLYRHPGRQGIHPEEEYIMQHDIYSLGVCLLELGLWSSFVKYDDDDNQAPPTPAEWLQISELISARDKRRAATEIKEILINVAQKNLPRLIGRIYTEVVVSCLTCLDKDNELFGDEKEFQDEDGIQVGVRYIEKVSLLLEESRYRLSAG